MKNIFFTALAFCGMAIASYAQQQPPKLHVVATTSEHNWNGIAISNDNRLFADFPRWEKGSNPSLVEIKDGKEIPFPGNGWNEWQPGKDPKTAFVSLNSLYINRADNHLWVTDAGEAFYKTIVPQSPKLVEIDLVTNKVVNVFLIDEEYAPVGSHLNDIRIQGDHVFITESGTGTILVLNRKTKAIRRLLAGSKLTKADPQGQPVIDGFRLQGADGKTPAIHADQLDLSADGKTLFFMSPFGPNLYKVAVADLLNESLNDDELEKRVTVDRTVNPVGGIVMDDKDNLYLSEIETGSIRCEGADKQTKWILKDPRLVWPDAYSIALDGTFYMVVAQISNMTFMRKGEDLRRPPYYIFSFKPER
ncbi:L-dopachrome tautomerase-related protein [Sphingobacterium thalpophilum]|uniref:L-dopachrome tautomerase-related protein n=1 Tax=Sphingobacterium thalpophilum TaxID=259 RepID=UPI0024A6894B|nr:L-dopachrome tautomerase-related protein [Sphingobacterium thalpophilum]